jgi:hypothetical protein
MPLYLRKSCALPARLLISLFFAACCRSFVGQEGGIAADHIRTHFGKVEESVSKQFRSGDDVIIGTEYFVVAFELIVFTV